MKTIRFVKLENAGDQSPPLVILCMSKEDALHLLASFAHKIAETKKDEPIELEFIATITQ